MHVYSHMYYKNDTVFSVQALKCSKWDDGEPTSVEEDLWDDSLLTVSSLSNVSVSYT